MISNGLRLTLLALCLAATSAGQAADRPNIIFMLSDDQGWSGLSAAMHPDVGWSRSSIVETPNLETLAAQGMRFSAAYSPASVCSPTRISLQTGKSPAALHWTKAAPPETGRKLVEPQLIKQIARDETTIAELLRSAGYATAHYGKWHIRGGGPAAHGYDEGDGETGNEHAYRFSDPNPVDIFGMAKRAASFMEKSQRAGKPFFIQLSWHALHAPENALNETLLKYALKMNSSPEEKRVGGAALAENLDTGVGMVMAAVDRLGLSGKTYVIYMSDNGGGGGGGRRSGRGSGGLSGGKGSVHEGGIRVPFIIRGPGIAKGSWCHERIVGYDLFPTFCEWAGVKSASLPDGLEGGSLAGLFDDGRGKVTRSRKTLVFHFPHYQGIHAPHSALMSGKFKLLKFYEDNRLALFDLESDISERVDLAQKMPETARKLNQLLVAYLNEIDAGLPTANRRTNSEPKATGRPRPEKGRPKTGRPKPGQPRPRRKPLKK